MVLPQKCPIDSIISYGESLGTCYQAADQITSADICLSDYSVSGVHDMSVIPNEQ